MNLKLGWQNGQQLDKLRSPEYLILAAKSPQFIVGEGHSIFYMTDLLFADRVHNSSLWSKATTFDKLQSQGALTTMIQVVVGPPPSTLGRRPRVHYNEDISGATLTQHC